jgi:hypothetical protein
MVLYSLSIDKIPLFNKTDKKSRPKKESCVDLLIFLRQNTSYQLILLDLDFSENPIPTKFPTQKVHKLAYPSKKQENY